MTKFQDTNERRKEMAYYTYDEFKKFISYEEELYLPIPQLMYWAITEGFYHRICNEKGEKFTQDFGKNVFGPQTFTSAPCICSAKIFDNATLECKISPTITIFFPPTSPNFSLIVKLSNKA